MSLMMATRGFPANVSTGCGGCGICACTAEPAIASARTSEPESPKARLNFRMCIRAPTPGQPAPDGIGQEIVVLSIAHDPNPAGRHRPRHERRPQFTCRTGNFCSSRRRRPRATIGWLECARSWSPFQPRLDNAMSLKSPEVDTRSKGSAQPDPAVPTPEETAHGRIPFREQLKLPET